MVVERSRAVIELQSLQMLLLPMKRLVDSDFRNGVSVLTAEERDSQPLRTVWRSDPGSILKRLPTVLKTIAHDKAIYRRHQSTVRQVWEVDGGLHCESILHSRSAQCSIDGGKGSYIMLSRAEFPVQIASILPRIVSQAVFPRQCFPGNVFAVMFS